MPVDWLELRLCRDVYHCTPSELAEQDADQVNRHLRLLAVEARIENFRHGKGAKGAGAGAALKARAKRRAKAQAQEKEAADEQVSD